MGRVIWQVEKSEFCRAVLARHWPDAQRFHDVKEVGSETPPVDLICGGFPCQPFSRASHGRRVAEDLWPEMFRVVCALRPRFVVAENVALDPIQHAAEQLADQGFACVIAEVPAALVGAPHQRSRWFVVADTHSDSQPSMSQHVEVARNPPLAEGVSWAAEPIGLGVANGLPGGLDRLEALGNAVVPLCAELIGRWLMQTIAAR